jgi:hypothetical protein
LVFCVCAQDSIRFIHFFDYRLHTWSQCSQIYIRGGMLNRTANNCRAVRSSLHHTRKTGGRSNAEPVQSSSTPSGEPDRRRGSEFFKEIAALLCAFLASLTCHILLFSDGQPFVNQLFVSLVSELQQQPRGPDNV